MEIVPHTDIGVASSLIDHLKKAFGIDLLVSHMQLYGYMYRKKESSPQVYFWQGDADAVGWYENKNTKEYGYVIVDWRVVELLNYWAKDKYAFGKHLHQCLVYARLLQLHLKLEYLPSILIVPISNNNGKDIQAGFFWGYPEDCTSAMEQFSWSLEQPKPPQKIYAKWPFNPEKLKEDVVVDEKMLLKDLFADGAKVKDLLQAFDFNALKVVKETKEE